MVALTSCTLVPCTPRSLPSLVHTSLFPLLVMISFSWRNTVHLQAVAMHGVALRRLFLWMDASARCLAADVDCSIC